VQCVGFVSFTSGIGIAFRVGMYATASGPIIEDVHGNDDLLSIE
jgi:hypothetical protein